MRRRAIFLILIYVICISLYGCNKSENREGGATSASPTPSDASLADFSHIEKHLVWYHDEMIARDTDPRIFIEMNKLLLERGYDFVVDFVTQSSLTEDEYRIYQQNLRTYKEQGKQIDLIFTGWAMQGEKTYDNAVRDELLLSLDDYLESTEGKKLYNAFPERLWEMMRRNGKVYGICENGWYGRYYSATLNRQLLEKYEVEAPEKFSFTEYFQTIQEVYERAKKDGVELFPIYLDAESVYSYLGYYKLDGFWVKQTEERKVSYVNPYGDEEAKKLFALLEKYREAFGGYGSMSEYWDTIQAGTQIACFTPTLLYRSCSNRNTSYSAYTYEPQQMYYAMPMHNIVHGVASWATYPEEAKTLLTLISTDEEFINLLYYGVEGIHYRLENGRMIEINEDEPGSFGGEIRVNETLVYPRLAEPDNKKEVLQKHQQEVVFLPLAVEELSKEPLSEEEKKIAEIFRRAEGLWLGEYENAEKVAEQICEELEAANVEEVLKKRTEKIYSKGE